MEPGRLLDFVDPVARPEIAPLRLLVAGLLGRPRRMAAGVRLVAPDPRATLRA